jgi:hypothetical protein
VNVYVYGATVDDAELFKKLSNKQHLVDRTVDRTVPTYFKNLGIALYRTVATDKVLATALVEELKLRGIEPGEDQDHIALISEWDTFYGQTFPTMMENCFANPKDRDCTPDEGSLESPWVHELSYLRGLDGALPTPEGTEDQKTGRSSDPAEKQAGAKDANKTQVDSKAFDRPFGEGQQDYLRRIAERLRKINEDLRRDDKGSIKAIGVLGSDVFDKLLVLRALRPYFPEALFFTTDFDQTLMMPSELSWTRNLIISSSFGPELRPEIQCEIPPFRGSYQTAAFLATQLAIRDANGHWDEEKQLSRWLSHARVFEIKRTGRVIDETQGSTPPRDNDHSQNECMKFTTDEAPSPAFPQGSDQQRNTCKYLESCDDIQPRAEKLFPRFERITLPGFNPEVNVATLFAVMFALAALLMFCIPWLWKGASGNVRFIGFGLFAVASACFYWEQLAEWLTSDGTGDGNGEPIAWLEGVSVWPTVFLRGLSILLSLYLIWRAASKLRTNLNDIVHKMKLPADTTPLRLLEKSYFSYRLGDRKSEGPLDTLEPYDIAKAWSEYVHRDRLVPRLWRVAGYVIVMLILGFVLGLIFGHPLAPTRGASARGAFCIVTAFDVVLTQFVIFFVFDATLFCLLFVNELRRGLTQWPLKTREIYEDQLGLKHELVAEWIDLGFVARRTKCISNLIYYPFVVIALLIVSRSTVFANYPPSTAILIIQGVSLAIAGGFAVWLRWASESARDKAKSRLMAGIVLAKGLEDGGRAAGQLETLLSGVDGLHEGAFSPFSEQPVVRALLLPLGSFGWMKLLENGQLPGL